MTNLVKKVLLFAALIVFAKNLSAQGDALTAMQTEDWDKAIAILSKSADQKGMLALGNAYLAKGDKNKATETFKNAFASSPEGAYAFIANGRILLLQNNTPEADKQFAKASKAGKKDIDALRAVGESYLYGPTRNLTRAEELLKAAYTFKTKDYATLMALGYLYKEVPNGGLAAQHYEFAQAIEPKNPLGYYMQARVYRQAKLPDQFIKYLEKTNEVDAGYTPALRGIAEYWYYFKRNYPKAEAAYEHLQKNGREVVVEDEMALANCYFLNKKYKECSDLVENIIKKDGSKNYLRRLLGYCYYEQGEYQKAHDILKDYFTKVTKDKELATDYLYFGDSKIKIKGDTASAISDFRVAMTMDSSVWPKYKEIGGLLFKQKKYCEAGDAYTMYLDSMAKPEPMDFYNLGNCHYFCRADTMHFQKAFAAYKKVTELVPTAGIGWFWAGKAGSKLEPDVSTNPALSSEYGVGFPYFEKYLPIGLKDREKNRKDIIAAYEYIVYYHYVKSDNVNFQTTLALLLEIDPENYTGKGLQEMVTQNGGTIPPPSAAPIPGMQTPAPSTTPIKPNGGGTPTPKH